VRHLAPLIGGAALVLLQVLLGICSSGPNHEKLPGLRLDLAQRWSPARFGAAGGPRRTWPRLKGAARELRPASNYGAKKGTVGRPARSPAGTAFGPMNKGFLSARRHGALVG